MNAIAQIDANASKLNLCAFIRKLAVWHWKPWQKDWIPLILKEAKVLIKCDHECSRQFVCGVRMPDTVCLVLTRWSMANFERLVRQVIAEIIVVVLQRHGVSPRTIAHTAESFCCLFEHGMVSMKDLEQLGVRKEDVPSLLRCFHQLGNRSGSFFPMEAVLKDTPTRSFRAMRRGRPVLERFLSKHMIFEGFGALDALYLVVLTEQLEIGWAIGVIETSAFIYNIVALAALPGTEAGRICDFVLNQLAPRLQKMKAVAICLDCSPQQETVAFEVTQKLGMFQRVSQPRELQHMAKVGGSGPIFRRSFCLRL